MSERVIEGVSADVNKAMNAVTANVLREDGLLLRHCEHGIAHPVGHLSGGFHLWDDERRARQHEQYSPQRYPIPSSCCGCCKDW